MKEEKVIFWDFDGTLAYQKGRFGRALFRVLNENEKEHNYKIEDIRPFLQDGFPWHNPEKSYLHLVDPKEWWNYVEQIFVKAYVGIGLDTDKAVKYSKIAHLYYVDSSGFYLYEDTKETLEYFLKKGWKNVILSNHVPELPDIVNDLGLNTYLTGCISSASVGYEKPNPEIFKIALNYVGNPQTVWMIGDNIIADVKGAEAVGIKAILVRTLQEEKVGHYAENLHEVITIIEKEEAIHGKE